MQARLFGPRADLPLWGQTLPAEFAVETRPGRLGAFLCPSIVLMDSVGGGDRVGVTATEQSSRWSFRPDEHLVRWPAGKS